MIIKYSILFETQSGLGGLDSKYALFSSENLFPYSSKSGYSLRASAHLSVPYV